MKKVVYIILTALFLTSGCRHTSTNDQGLKNNLHKGPADQVHFEEKEIRVGGLRLTVEVAKKPGEHARGLMYRQKLDKDSGMLFVFPDERKRSFWMKNTFIPLSIGFFDKDKKLIEWFDMKPAESEMQTDLPMYHSRAPAKYALEVNLGWFERNNIKLGAQLAIEE